MHVYIDLEDAKRSARRLRSAYAESTSPYTLAAAQNAVALAGGWRDWHHLEQTVGTDAAPHTYQNHEVISRLGACPISRRHGTVNVFRVVAPNDHPDRPVQPHPRFAGKAARELAEEGWIQEDDDVVIQRKAWTVISRPHPDGATIRLLTVAENGPEFLGMHLPGFLEDHASFGRALDYPSFAVPFLAELDAIGVRWAPRLGHQLMGIAMGRLTPDLMINIPRQDEGRDKDDRDFVVYVPVDGDPVAAAARTADELKRFEERLAQRRAQIRALPLVIERSAVVALCGHVKTVDEVMDRLSMAPPMILPDHPPVGSRRMKGSRDGIRILPSRRGEEGGVVTYRSEKSVTADTPAPFKWTGNVFQTATSANAERGTRLGDVTDHPMLRHSGLVIDKVSKPGPNRRMNRITVASDLLTEVEARELAMRLMGESS